MLTQVNTMKTTHRRLSSESHPGLPTFLRRSLSMLGIGLLLLLFLRPDSAQAQAPGTEGYWKQHFVAQVNTLLRASNPTLREKGMELIIQYQNDIDPAFNFALTRSHLYAIFLDQTNADAERILALSALYATDRGTTSERLTDWLAEGDPSERLLRHVRLALQQRG